MRFTILLLIPFLFLSSCTIDWHDEKDAQISGLQDKVQSLEATIANGPQKEKAGVFSDEKLGVSFKYNNSEPTSEKFNVEGNRETGEGLSIVQHVSKDYHNYVSVFYRSSSEGIEERLMRIMQDYGGKHPEKCEVISSGMDNLGFDHYSIDLKDKNIPLTNSERKDLEEAKKQSGIGGAFKEIELMNKYLLDYCGEYAVGAPPATSKTYGSYFLSSSGTVTILYHPAGADPSFIDFSSLTLSDPK